MREKVSVVMATYNGEKYIREQLESILENLNEEDEIIISDDGSKDSTRSIIKEYMTKDKRIKLLDGPKNGIKQNFANGIKNATGKYIFLADQDDIWKQNKVESMLNVFEKEKVKLVIHDAEIVDEDLKATEESFFKYRNSGNGILKNIWKNTYIGCCIAFDATIKDKILPIPNDIEMHDQWIGIIAEMEGRVYFLKEVLILYRRHGDNNSQMKHYGIIKMIRNRLVLIKNILKIKQRRKK